MATGNVPTGAVVVSPGGGEALQGPAGGPLQIKVRGAHTAGTLTVVENVIAPDDGPPLHTHAGEDESWYVLEGILEFRLGDDISEAPAGSFVFVPRGMPHCFRNIDGSPARILVMFTPSGMEGFFERFAALPANQPITPASFQAAGEPFGMTVLGPPLAVTHPR
ncbi:MAG: cupin domain-containing protein [Thermoleophilia bacterium]